MDKKKEYAKNTIILLIGKFCTQFMTFFLIPLYTHKLLTEDYGYVDLLQSYISLFIPIISLRMDTAVFRFLIDVRKDEKGKKKIITGTILTLLIQLILFVFLYFIITSLFNLKYKIMFLLNCVACMISGILLQIVRGLGKNKQYSIACIISGLSTLVVNCILILKFNWGADSILLSAAIANILCAIYLIFDSKIFKYIGKKFIDKNKIKEMLIYALPMIPNSLSWWIVNISDKTLITIFMSATYNGIYSVSCKFSNILNTIFTIFNMSWQETASLHINDDDRDEFLSDMINKLLMLFTSISIGILAVLPIFYDILIGKDYIESYTFIPILLIANVFNIFNSLIGGIYVALKKSKEIANTTIISAIINFAINILFIKHIGLYAASISTLIAYLAMSIYRGIDVQKYAKVTLSIKKIIISLLAFTIVSVTYYINNILINWISLVSVVLYSYYINREMIKSICRNIIRKLKK